MTLVLGFSVEPWGSPLIGAFLIPGTGVSLTMRKEIAPLLVAYCRDFDREVEPLRPGQCWGFNPKHIEGSNVWSNHAWGGAVDLNAPSHPMGKRGTFSPAQRDSIHRILGRYTFQGKPLLRSGMDYVRRPDDMHVEINVPRDVALAAVAALQTPRKPPPLGGNRPGSRALREGASGPDVAFVQRWLGVPDDGVFGPRTDTAVRRYQRTRGLPADGVVGLKTWRAMGIKFTG